MRRTWSGVTYYLQGRMELKVGFPEGEKKCKYCGLCHYDGVRKLSTCWATHETLLYPQVGLGLHCPLTFEEEETK